MTFRRKSHAMKRNVTTLTKPGRRLLSACCFLLVVTCCLLALRCKLFGMNRDPVITGLTELGQVYGGRSEVVSCTAYDPDGDSLTYYWSCTAGEIDLDSAPTMIVDFAVDRMH